MDSSRWEARTPLIRKLGIRPGYRVVAMGEPLHYKALLAPLPEDVRFESLAGPQTDIVHLFETSQKKLAEHLVFLRGVLRPNAAIWVSWQKRTARRTSSLNENEIRAVALPLGLVDVKVCAVDEEWSGLKLVLRREFR